MPIHSVGSYQSSNQGAVCGDHLVDLNLQPCVHGANTLPIEPSLHFAVRAKEIK